MSESWTRTATAQMVGKAAANWKAARRIVSTFCIAVVLSGSYGTDAGAQANTGLLPLAEGNYWVLGGENGPICSVAQTIRVQDIQSDTVYNSLEDVDAPSGREYFLLSIGRFSRLFPVEPQSVLVRQDEVGNVWIRGIVAGDSIMVSSNEQPWLMIEGSESWEFSFDEYEYSVGFLRLPAGDDYAAHAQRYVDQGVAHADPVYILAELNGNLWISEGGGSTLLVMLPGVGPIWIPIPTTETELQGLHYELTEAKIGGRLITRRETSIQAVSWAQLKFPSSLTRNPVEGLDGLW